MPIHDARIEECASCERRFDINFPKRMQKYQELHRNKQLHLWPCGFLDKGFYPTSIFAELYDTPWEDKPREVFFHSDECEEVYCRSGSFDYTECETCDRQVCEQNPRNGWMLQFRKHTDLGYICLCCYQDEILKNGQPRSDFEGHTIDGGMFFSYGNTEAQDAGFEEVPEFIDYFIRSADDVRPYNQHALKLIDTGHKVISGYERLAIGGLEGYVTMMSKAVP
ncbi:hypothetical protein MYX77_01005 [Acidobacteriia bacterium AH_259_A11_L15]|nr:hypothetical protein [Acidobacteriia bacterium AH_259_A11_L15]